MFLHPFSHVHVSVDSSDLSAAQHDTLSASPVETSDTQKEQVKGLVQAKR